MLFNVFLVGVFILFLICYVINKESKELYDTKESTKKAFVITSWKPFKMEKQDFPYIELVKSSNGKYHNNGRRKKLKLLLFLCNSLF